MLFRYSITRRKQKQFFYIFLGGYKRKLCGYFTPDHFSICYVNMDIRYVIGVFLKIVVDSLRQFHVYGSKLNNGAFNLHNYYTESQWSNITNTTIQNQNKDALCVFLSFNKCNVFSFEVILFMLHGRIGKVISIIWISSLIFCKRNRYCTIVKQ